MLEGREEGRWDGLWETGLTCWLYRSNEAMVIQIWDSQAVIEEFQSQLKETFK